MVYLEIIHLRQNGSTFPVEVSLPGRVVVLLYFFVLIETMSDKQVERKFGLRLLKQSAVEQLGKYALTCTKLTSLLDKAVNLITQALDIEYALVLELLKKENLFVVKASVGWSAEFLGQISYHREQVDRSLLLGIPSIVQNGRSKTILQPSDPLFSWLQARGIDSGINALIHGDEYLGILGVYTTQPRQFDRDDINFIQAIACILAIAADRLRSETESEPRYPAIELNLLEAFLSENEPEYRNLANAIPSIAWKARPDGAVDYFNQRWFDYTGISFEESKGWGWLSAVHPDDRQRCWEDWQKVIQTGELCELEYRFRQANGIYRWHLGRAVPVRNQQNQIVCWVGTATDIDAQKHTQEKERFLSQASQELASSLNYQAILDRVANLAVPKIADWCAVDILEEGWGTFPTIRRLAVAHTDPAKVEWAKQLQERYPHDPNSQYGVANVLRTGQPELYSEIPDELLVEVAQDEEHLNLMRNMGFSSAIIVPTIARGRILGTITFISAESGRRYTASDLALAEDLACRAALAVDNARLYGESQEAEAQILQYASRLQLLVDASQSFAEVKSSFQEAFPIPKEFLLKSVSPELEIVLENICQRLSKLMGDTCTIQMLSQDEQWLIPVAIYNPKPKILAQMREMLTDRQPANAEPFCQVIQTGEPFVGTGDLGFKFNLLFPYSFSCPISLPQLLCSIVPLTIQGRTIGLITLWRHHSANPYTLDDRLFLQEIANRVALAISNLRLLEAVQEELIHRAEAEVALRESEERFRTMADSAPVLLWVSGSDGICTFLNQAWLNFTGKKLAEELSYGWTESIHPDDLQQWFDTYTTAFKTRQNFRTEYRLRRTDGQYRWILDTGTPRFMSDGSFAGYIGSCIDISERKLAEEALQLRADELANLSSVLAQTNTVLEKKNQELDQFAYIVSHDLKAPLRAIANLSQWIEEDLQEKLTSDTQHQMNLLRGRVHRMEALIEGILEYSRVGRVKNAKEVVDVGDLLQNIIDSLALPPQFTIEVKTGMPILTTERLPLEQVFTNLIGNAIGHHDRTDGKIWISAQKSGEFYEFAVRDDGPGIAPQYHEKIFVIFQTLVARDRMENTGIGLSLVKKIVEDKGGLVWVESDVGKGATFYFTWPQ